MTTMLPTQVAVPVTPPPENTTFSAFSGASTAPSPHPDLKMRLAAQAQINPTCPPPPTSPSARPPTMATSPSARRQATQAQAQADLYQDPQYAAMASRIAAYYQSRSQAIAQFQQQRCQAWANVQQQKCHEVTSTAMLVVAWYVRDRIKRRRRRRKETFKAAVAERGASRKRISRGEVVRRWVLQVPDAAVPPNVLALESPRDEDEATFSMDATTPSQDRDDMLYEMADNMIKRQFGKVQAPLFGALSFDDESDSEKSEEEGGGEEGEEGEEEEEEEEEHDQDADMDLEEDDSDDGDDDLESDEFAGEGVHGAREADSPSQRAQRGTPRVGSGGAATGLSQSS